MVRKRITNSVFFEEDPRRIITLCKIENLKIGSMTTGKKITRHISAIAIIGFNACRGETHCNSLAVVTQKNFRRMFRTVYDVNVTVAVRKISLFVSLDKSEKEGENIWTVPDEI
jgi:hypothetical protein